MRIKKHKKSHSKKSYRRKRRNPMLLGNPSRKRRRSRKSYRRRRNPSFVSKKRLSGVMMNAAAGIGGAAVVSFATKGVTAAYKAITKNEPPSAMKNWLSLGTAIGLAMLLPKFKVAGKYTESVITGGLIAAGMNVLSSTFGMGKFLTLSGESNPELDKIIANLNVSGIEDTDLLGLPDSTISGYDGMLSGEDDDLLGVEDSMYD